MFDGGVVLLVIMAVLVLAVVAFLFSRKKNQDSTVANTGEQRHFTQEDRQAVLLIRELDDIIGDVKKAIK